MRVGETMSQREPRRGGEMRGEDETKRQREDIKQEDKETRRRGDKETKRRGKGESQGNTVKRGREEYKKRRQVCKAMERVGGKQTR